VDPKILFWLAAEMMRAKVAPQCKIIVVLEVNLQKIIPQHWFSKSRSMLGPPIKILG